MTELVGAYPGFNDDYLAGRWEPATKQILETYLRPGSLFIDIGAWIGPVTRWALDLGATVHTYEPDPIAYQHLTENCPTASNSRYAVSNESYVQLDQPNGDSNTRIVAEGTAIAYTIPPRIILDRGTPALIKIDVEGYETEILPDILRYATCPIWVAWHEDYWPPHTGWNFTGWQVDGPVTGWGHSLLTRTT